MKDTDQRKNCAQEVNLCEFENLWTSAGSGLVLSIRSRCIDNKWSSTTIFHGRLRAC